MGLMNRSIGVNILIPSVPGGWCILWSISVLPCDCNIWSSSRYQPSLDPFEGTRNGVVLWVTYTSSNVEKWNWVAHARVVMNESRAKVNGSKMGPWTMFHFVLSKTNRRQCQVILVLFSIWLQFLISI